MIRARHIAVAVLLFIALASLSADLWVPLAYDTQFREAPNARPNRFHWLGTDAIGRDRFSRLVYGTRVSLLLAPAAALVSTLLAACIGGAAGFMGGAYQRFAMFITDLFMSLPWLFVLITVRALLPLNVAPVTSAMVTFLLLGILGWAAAARVICAGASSICRSDFILQARLSGVSGARLLIRHVWPNLTPVLRAQFWISVPVFILAEANLGILGLGVTEPLPSWGGMLRELEEFAGFSYGAWKLVPLVLLVGVVSCFQLLIAREEVAV